MANLSQEKRQRMLAFLKTIREEHKDDDEVLIALGEIESELNAKKYGLVWERHEEAVDVQMRNNVPVFTECVDKEITTTKGGVNFLLEGDNLHSLRLLEKTHTGRIDVIYIDPPYNTENKDFIYDDAFVDKNDGFRHSKWLSFMNERLQIAKRLLSSSGVLIISIGYHEVHNLMVMCQEMFENKQITCVTVQTSGGKPNGGFTFLQEYLVFITPTDFNPKTMSFTGGIERSPFEGLTLSTFDKTTRPNQTYPIFIDIPVFLLMKQAISTGWDCPRAKILVKLREGMSESFEIQTIGRIRRMPEAKHYEDDLLDFCYVYTFDEKYKAGLLSNMDKAYETRRLFLKEKCKTFTLEKEIRDLDIGSLGERNVLNKIYDALVRKYNLTTSTTDNKLRFMAAGYQFGDEIIGHALYGEYVRTDMVAESTTYYTTRKRVNTHKHGIELLHSVDTIKSTIGMQSAKVKTILERLFRRGGSSYKKLLLLDTSEFYAFIINNEHRLKEEFREVTACMNTQMTLPLNPKKSIFHIPEQDFYKYDPGVKNEVEYLTNAYHDYTSGYATSLVRSTSEMLFEQFCESRDDIEWVYKNGDTGQQYFSIVYRDGLQNQWLFYADYIIMKKDGTVWVIETKGGESKGKDKNIDIQIENKFNAFKNYATEHSLHWGFVRDKDNQLYINNTEFAHDMVDNHWVPLSQEF